MDPSGSSHLPDRIIGSEPNSSRSERSCLGQLHLQEYNFYNRLFDTIFRGKKKCSSSFSGNHLPTAGLFVRFAVTSSTNLFPPGGGGLDGTGRATWPVLEEAQGEKLCLQERLRPSSEGLLSVFCEMTQTIVNCFQSSRSAASKHIPWAKRESSGKSLRKPLRAAPTGGRSTKGTFACSFERSQTRCPPQSAASPKVFVVKASKACGCDSDAFPDANLHLNSLGEKRSGQVLSKVSFRAKQKMARCCLLNSKKKLVIYLYRISTNKETKRCGNHQPNPSQPKTCIDLFQRQAASVRVCVSPNKGRGKIFIYVMYGSKEKYRSNRNKVLEHSK